MLPEQKRIVGQPRNVQQLMNEGGNLANNLRDEATRLREQIEGSTSSESKLIKGSLARVIESTASRIDAALEFLDKRSEGFRPDPEA